MDQQAINLTLQKAVELHRNGKVSEAADLYREILASSPRDANALHLLGQLVPFDEAITLITKAIQLKPEITAYRYSLAQTFLCKEALDQAYVCYEEIASITPEDSQCWFEMGRIATLQNKHPLAVEQLRRALSLNPKHAPSYCELGKVMNSLGDGATAEQFFRVALSLDPKNVEAQCNLGNALRKQEKTSEAIFVYQAFLREQYGEEVSDPTTSGKHDSIYWQVKNNLALSLHEQGETQAAIQHYRDVLAHDPQNAFLHTNLAYVLLAGGHMLEGWSEHEWRWKLKGFPTPQRDFGCPQWKGEQLNGASILLHCEQGLGDTLQFVRYAPLIAERGGQVILEVQPSLKDLLSHLPGIGKIYSRGESLPSVQFHCPLMSLPFAFQTTEKTIPNHVPYIPFPSDLTLALQKRWPSEKLRVGIAWAGNKIHPNDRYRSMKLQDFVSLAELENVEFYSLQLGEAVQQIAEVLPEFKVLDVCSRYKDFYETAAFLSGLDLVISIDSAVAHLAGALGVPVWILLPQSRTDWRWALEREHSPWYPTARLFRQTQLGDWSPVIEAVKTCLQDATRVSLLSI